MGIDQLIANNRAWARAVESEKPGFFRHLAGQQAPPYLWIGCADSRVPANEIVGLAPGEVFVHRNVANLVIHTDLNCLSVLQYAVDVLSVSDIIVCGHYGCGGISAALGDESHGLIDNWLLHIRDLARQFRPLLAELADDETRARRMVELNVIGQAVNVGNTTVVRAAWRRGQRLAVHGVVYDIHDGILKRLAMDLEGEADVTRSADRAADIALLD